MIIGDSFSSIFKAAGLPSILSSRPAAISGVALCCSLPLCLLQSLERLKFSSLAGVGGLIYTAGFMTFRQCAGAYAPGGALFEATLPHMRPRFDAPPSSVLGLVGTPRIFVLVSILATAFLAHFIAPQFYTELAPKKLSSSKASTFTAATPSTMPRFSWLTAGGFGGAACLTGIIMSQAEPGPRHP